MNIRMIVHDIRTPLNALLLSTQSAKMMAIDNEELTRTLRLIEKNAQSVAELVESVLGANADSPTDKIHLTFRHCNPSELIRGAIEQIASIATAKSLTLKQELLTDIILKVDKIRIIRVLVNLLSNAIKFTPTGGKIDIEVKLRSNDGHSVIVFSVRDSGPGISEADINRIFVEGVSISNTCKTSNGLGLTVCKELVEAHGGRIWVETNRPQGAAFSFSIPISS